MEYVLKYGFLNYIFLQIKLSPIFQLVIIDSSPEMSGLYLRFGGQTHFG